MEEQAIQLLEQKRFSELRELLKEMEPFDIAVMLEDVPEEQLPLMFRILPKELAADTFVEMDSDMQELLILGAVILLRALLSLLIHFEMKEEHDHPLATFPKQKNPPE